MKFFQVGTKVDDYWEPGKALLQDPAKFLESLFQPRTQALSSGKERPWSELVTCHPDSGW